MPLIRKRTNRLSEKYTSEMLPKNRQYFNCERSRNNTWKNLIQFQTVVLLSHFLAFFHSRLIFRHVDCEHIWALLAVNTYLVFFWFKLNLSIIWKRLLYYWHVNYVISYLLLYQKIFISNILMILEVSFQHLD